MYVKRTQNFFVGGNYHEIRYAAETKKKKKGRKPKKMLGCHSFLIFGTIFQKKL